MKTIRTALAVILSSLIATQPVLLQVAYAAQGNADADQQLTQIPPANTQNLMPRELTGVYDDQTAALNAERNDARRAAVEAGLGEDGSPAPRSPMAGLPILDTALAAKTASVKSDEVFRVLVHLSFLPHAQVFADVTSQYQAQIDDLEADRIEFLQSQDVKRDRSKKTDSDNYVAVLRNTDEEKARMRAIGERNEALSLLLKEETTARLRTLIDDNQASVIEEITSLGGNVEFTTIAGNTIVATVPAGALKDIAKIAGVMRVLEDSMMEGHLNVADNAAMVDPSDTALLGLWDNAFAGGIYDPAIIDSGVDQSHPAMVDSVVPLRNNYCTWYLSAANDSAAFDDAFTCDDRQGHGTHVAGIVASKGSAGWTNHRGMAYDVEKVVNLKAGWLNTAGTTSMFWSDKYQIVDRALNDSDALVPGGTFIDDVDGFNLSYGGATTLDDTDGGRFWDSVISTYADTPVTVSAGNSGPSNTLFNDPALSYNVITVANFNDRGSSTRVDDIINAGSTVGPTAGGRRKPDIAAPGTSISAPRHNWEGANSDNVSLTGTSMAAPMVMGVIMDLMDAGVLDELELKALLINTAQKNLPGMNIENDADGWDPQIGWGAMNAYAAYFHRIDAFRDFLEVRDPDNNHESNDYQLYKGSMRDEGVSGEGRDRATMTWNRQATYLATTTPDSYYTLTDMNLRLYNESNNILIAQELGAADNVHQVRINSGAPDTDVVLKAYTWSTAFAHGDMFEPIAVATEDGFTRVDFPIDFQGIAVWPSEVEPNEIFNITFWLRNDSDVASHNNTFNLALPAGWTLISGIDTVNIGSAAAGASTNQVVYTLRAPPSPAVGNQTITIAHSHSSYLENYGNFNWNLGINVAVDITPPSPSPMAFSTLPDDASTTSIDMQATSANDLNNDPITYYLDYTSSPSGGTGGTDSGWQESRSYVDPGLGINHNYCYRAYARDSANFPNLTTPSAISCAYTRQTEPTGVTLGAATTTSITVVSQSVPPNLTLGASGLQLRNATNGDNGPWQQSNAQWVSGSLTPATKYEFAAWARNGDGDTTANSVTNTLHTLANPPAFGSLTTASASSISVMLNANGNGPDAEYFIQNTTAGTASGWINSTSWVSGGLDCETPHNFQVRARNGEGIETLIVGLGSQNTGACVSDLDGDGVADGNDNCTVVPNPDQRDTNGDGFGNICDADFNNDGITNVVDLGILRTSFFATGDLDEDINGDGLVNVLDLGLVRSMFFMPPGPSGLAP